MVKGIRTILPGEVGIGRLTEMEHEGIFGSDGNDLYIHRGVDCISVHFCKTSLDCTLKMGDAFYFM